MASLDDHKIARLFSVKRIIIPLIIGLGVALWLLLKDFDKKAFDQIHWDINVIALILGAFALTFLKDFAFMLRLRIFTNKALRWKDYFQSIMLWEFSNAVSPSFIGGSAIAFFVLFKELKNSGRAIAIVMITALMDELFYVISVPVVLIIWSKSQIFSNVISTFKLPGGEFEIFGIFIIGFIYICLLATIISLAVFVSPKAFRKVLVRIFRLPFLRKWKHNAEETGNQIQTVSKEMRHKPIFFWLKIYGATYLGWASRYIVLNFLLLAFVTIDDHFLVFVRQMALWVVMLISPTPGGSGVAEYGFSLFYGDMIQTGIIPVIAVLWRIITYYPYLFAGIIILPYWLRKVYAFKAKN